MAEKILRLSMKRGVATIMYPRVAIEVDELYRGAPKLDPELCIACGACANACPAETISLEWRGDTIVWRLSYSKCIFCARCQEVCPTGAIRLSREFELASRSREDLELEARFSAHRCPACSRFVNISYREVEMLREIVECSELPTELKRKLIELSTLCPECKARYFAQSLARVYRRESREA